jgi:uncharacterized protein (TIRG00374 family)
MYFRVIINTVLGLVLIFIWLHFVNVNEIIQKLSDVRLVTIIPILFFLFCSPVIRALRLKILLSDIRKISFKDMVFLNGVSVMLNFFIPIRAGEVAKGVYLNQTYDLPIGKSVVWIFLDRLIDFLVLLALAPIFLSMLHTNLPQKLGFITMILALSVIVMIYFITYKVHLSRKVLKFITRFLVIEKVKIYFEHIFEFFLDGFSILRKNPKQWVFLVTLTFCAYLADAFVWYFGFLSLGSKQDLLSMYFGQIISALTYLVPAAPGYVGSAEASGLLVLSGVLGIDRGLASAQSVLVHLITAIAILIFGIISVYFLKIDLGKIFKKVLQRG